MGIDLRTLGLGIAVLRNKPIKCLDTAGNMPAAKADIIVDIIAIIAVAVAIAVLGTTACAIPRSYASLANICISSKSILSANLQSI